MSYLTDEVTRLDRYLNSGFSPLPNGQPRKVWADAHGEFIGIKNFPLPDQFQPDAIDLVLITTGYPERPPVGFHVLKKNNEHLLDQLQTIFQHTFDRAVIHQAEELEGYAWICFHYEDHRWFFDPDDPAEGDNITKFLNNFYTELEIAAKRA